VKLLRVVKRIILVVIGVIIGFVLSDYIRKWILVSGLFIRSNFSHYTFLSAMKSGEFVVWFKWYLYSHPELLTTLCILVVTLLLFAVLD